MFTIEFDYLSDGSVAAHVRCNGLILYTTSYYSKISYAVSAANRYICQIGG